MFECCSVLQFTCSSLFPVNAVKKFHLSPAFNQNNLSTTIVVMFSICAAVFVLVNVSYLKSICFLGQVWTIAVMFLSKKNKQLPHIFTVNLFLAQVSTLAHTL